MRVSTVCAAAFVFSTPLTNLSALTSARLPEAVIRAALAFCGKNTIL
jgi:hypothetical protein